uniref:ATP-dependent transporter ycf16 n=1 Tax=Bicosoecida sp. CB-2014 TaxID=1486930 RepID=A0A7S1CFW3_9STRA|mmetsp:Transcript_25282/g.88209  ORF Transcript_25282/g.88209 Transcript_25282/m.88209 type:complete len:740 (+) Transcript_25282:478-2697(+)
MEGAEVAPAGAYGAPFLVAAPDLPVAVHSLVNNDTLAARGAGVDAGIEGLGHGGYAMSDVWALAVVAVVTAGCLAVRGSRLSGRLVAAINGAAASHRELQARGKALLQEKRESGTAGTTGSTLLADASRSIDPLAELLREFRRTDKSLLAVATAGMLAFMFFKFIATPRIQYALLDVVIAQAAAVVQPTGSASSGDAIGASGLQRLFGDKAAPLAWAMAVVWASRFLALMVSDILFEMSTQKVRVGLRERLFNAILGQDTFFFDSVKSGELCARLTGDADKIEKVISESALRLGKAAMRIVGALVTMLYYHRVMCSLLVAFAPLEMWLGRRLGAMQKRVTEVRAAAMASADAAAAESISNARTVKCLAGQDHERTVYSSHLDRYLEVLRASLAPSAVLKYGHRAVAYTEGLVLALAGMWLILDHQMTVGEWLAFHAFYGNYREGLRHFIDLWTSLSDAMGHSKRYYAVLGREPTIPDTGGAKPATCTGDVHFRDVRFSYAVHGASARAAAAADVLNGVSFSLHPGRVVALVGASGAGKSTCVGLLSRLWDVTGGAIELDGRDVRELDATWVRQQVAVVEQSPALFDRSIADNIAYAMQPRPSQERIEAAARAACAHDFIARLAGGYDTLIGERGVRLSGGERQRIGLARALVRNPRVLVLDEATASLDAASEHAVQAALDRLLVGRATLVVAHRLSTVRAADEILVMDAGRIVERGTHESLLALAGGTYAAFVEHQRLR